MVTDLLGPSLEDLFKMCNRSFSLKSVLMLADQLISRIEFVHSHSIVHRDIKPANFVMSVAPHTPCSCSINPVNPAPPSRTPSSSSSSSSSSPASTQPPLPCDDDEPPATAPDDVVKPVKPTRTRTRSRTPSTITRPSTSATSASTNPPTPLRPQCPHHPLVNIIDFGLAKKFRDSVTQTHIPYYRHPDGLHGVGTSLFASINTHLGIDASRRDDLESLAYMLIYFMRGTLPWRKLRAPAELPDESEGQEMELAQVISNTEDREEYQQRVEEAWKERRENYSPVTATWDLIRDSKLMYESTLTEGLPEEFGVLYRYARSLEYDDLPDYEGLRRCFRGLAERMGIAYDGQFDWSVNGPSGDADCDVVDEFGQTIKAKKSPGSTTSGSKGIASKKVRRGRHCVACDARAKAREESEARSVRTSRT
ncbi:kinase-like protein [Coprinopsis marcescibilis]|uniref:non-specific serine/threonine protein kinase n=1 Tax=Coprinopsis marcescibilis TaxID=230819 RepID=A0A5C3KYX7_COPMA|nr:kinase-like protein [Coprinopsis marcescibilis]